MSKGLMQGVSPDGYETDDVDVDHYGHPEGVPESAYMDFSDRAGVSIRWRMEIDERSWGVKDMFPQIPDQTIELPFLEPTEDEDREHEVTWEIKDADYRFERHADFDRPGVSLTIRPTRVEVDFDRRRTTVVFEI